MSTLRAILVLVTLVAVAANPLVAMAMPCCCTQRAETTRTCCQKAAEQSAPEQHACCAKKHKVEEVFRLGDGCCCVKAPPVTTPARETLTQQETEGQLLAVSAFASFDSAVLAPVSRYLDHSPGHFSLSGPPLLSLYCTWLK